MKKADIEGNRDRYRKKMVDLWDRRLIFIANIVMHLGNSVNHEEYFFIDWK